jgi:SAM-dependent methyltransferase
MVIRKKSQPRPASFDPPASGPIDGSTPGQLLHRHCPLCQRDNRHQPVSPYSRGVWTIKQCDDCQFVYLENALPYCELIDNYAWGKSFFAERQFRQRREPLFDSISQRLKALRMRYLPRDKALGLIHQYVGRGRILDVGCGSGQLFCRLDDRFIPYGIEIGAEAATVADQCARARGGKVHHQDALAALALFPGQLFDGILMHAYLEHENSPQDVLTHAARTLLPGGRIIIKVPNFASWNRLARGGRWCGFRFPDHVNYFTPKTLVAMLQRARLRVVRFRLRDRMPTSDNMWLVAERPRDDGHARNTSQAA